MNKILHATNRPTNDASRTGETQHMIGGMLRSQNNVEEDKKAKDGEEVKFLYFGSQHGVGLLWWVAVILPYRCALAQPLPISFGCNLGLSFTWGYVLAGHITGSAASCCQACEEGTTALLLSLLLGAENKQVRQTCLGGGGGRGATASPHLGTAVW